MQYLNSWRRWTWDEIYAALRRERAVGEPFEVDHMLAPDPIRCGAELGGLEAAWHYRFLSSDGEHLCIQDRGDRYLAWLEAEHASADDELNFEKNEIYSWVSAQVQTRIPPLHRALSALQSRSAALEADPLSSESSGAALGEAMMLGAASVALLVLPRGLLALLEGVVLPLLG